MLAPMTPAPMTVALWMCCMKDAPLVHWKKSPAALFRTSASFRLEKSVVLASCVAGGCKPDKFLNPLEDRGNALAAADTLGGQRIATADALQKTRRLARDTRSGGAQRVPEGDRAAVDVQGLVANSEITGARERLARKGFVQFDHVDRRDLELCAQQGFLRCADGADAHDIRRAAGDRDAHDAGEGSQPMLFRVVLAAHQHGRSAVGQRR